MNKIIILLIIFIIFGGVYFQLQWKPNQMRKTCLNKANAEKEIALRADDLAELGGYPLIRADYDKIFNDTYQNCLSKQGLEK